MGATGSGTTIASFMSAENTAGASLSLNANGVRIPLPHQQVMGTGFNAAGNNELFNFSNAGTYLVIYNIRTTAAIATSACVSDSNSSAYNCIPSLTQSSTTGLAQFQGQAIVNLPANTQLNLRLIGLNSTTLQGGVGASLTVVRLQ